MKLISWYVLILSVLGVIGMLMGGIAGTWDLLTVAYAVCAAVLAYRTIKPA